jgi:hypothetical protein
MDIGRLAPSTRRSLLRKEDEIKKAVHNVNRFFYFFFIFFSPSLRSREGRPRSRSG